jgi:hypothetical protein
VLCALDLDFANIQAYVAYVRKLMAVLQHRDPSGELWIIQRDRVRFRQSG